MNNRYNSSQEYHEFRAHANKARAIWAQNHPGEPVHVNQAYKEYCLHMGWKPDAMETTFRHHPEQRVLHLHNATRIICPVCGTTMGLDVIRGCKESNPFNYSSMLYCLSEDCCHHIFVQTPLIDTLNILEEDGDLNKLQRVDGRL